MSWEDTPFFDNVWPFAHVHNELFVAMKWTTATKTRFYISSLKNNYDRTPPFNKDENWDLDPMTEAFVAQCLSEGEWSEGGSAGWAGYLGEVADQPFFYEGLTNQLMSAFLQLLQPEQSRSKPQYFQIIGEVGFLEGSS